MKTVFIEASDGSNFNWGKFMVGQLEMEELQRPCNLPLDDDLKSNVPLLLQIGFNVHAIFVCDLQTMEGAWFEPNAATPDNAKYDLDNHKVWVCPMFEPFLKWLYTQDVSDLDKLPKHVNLGDVPTAFRGYRREGQ